MSARSPLVSILVPTYNAAPFLAALLDSIQAQSHPNYEVLILDDGSTDGTSAVLEPYRRDARFHLASWTPNHGVNAATANLLGLMKGDYWCNPGADDVLHPGFLSGRLELLESNPGAVLVHGPCETIDEAGRPTTHSPPALDLPFKMEGARALQVLLQHNIINTPSLMARSDLTRPVLPFFNCDWRYAQDWYLWLLLAASGCDLLWDSRCLHQYRVHQTSLTMDPRYAAIRDAEIRLVPLGALRAASRFSQPAAGLWLRWGRTLYRRWLFRAAKLHRSGLLQNHWLGLAGRDYYGDTGCRLSLYREMVKHGPGAVVDAVREKRAVKKQSFRVAGLAQIDDPLFR